MVTYIALLRGINVGGSNLIRMTDIVAVFESLGFLNVKTYLQSGNVVFEFRKSVGGDLRKRIEKALEKKTGKHVAVLIRSPDEIKAIHTASPYQGGRFKEDRVFTTFLSNTPEPEKLAALKNMSFPGEYFEIHHEVIFIYVPNGYGRAKLNNTFLEKTLQVQATTRNMRTVRKLIELVSGAAE